MKFIKHRVNTAEDLSRWLPEWGAEIDLRSDVSSGELHLSHDPFHRGMEFGSWLARYAAAKPRGTLILNTKEDALEARILEQLQNAGVFDFFFLDTTLPTLVRHTEQGRRHFAVRLSSYEPAALAMRFSGKADWLWVDCFQLQPLSMREIVPLKGHFKICLVSPELQGGGKADFARFRELASVSDAICTKDPLAWKALLGGKP